MAEWRYRDLALYRDDVCVGLVDDTEVAAEIVETMNRVGKLLEETLAEREKQQRQARRESVRSTSGRHAVRCPTCDQWKCCEHCGCLEPRPADAERRSEATPKGSSSSAAPYAPTEPWPDDLETRAALGPSRVDPYDTTKGGAVALGDSTVDT